jgi:endogenous inhibitor of DNA gyrase (YacG/DUF329 family)
MANRKTGATARCPICRGVLPTEAESDERGPKYAPLCSLRCKRIDLAMWLGEGYRIAGEPADGGAMQDDETQPGGDR